MKKLRLGLTLIELVVVVAILGVLAAMLLPKFEGLQSAANHTAAGSSMADLNRLIGTYKTSKTVYPSGFDSLMDSTGSALWAGGNAGAQTKGLHSQLTGSGTTTDKLTTATLTAAEITGLRNAGITTLYHASTAANTASGPTARAGDAFTIAAPITAGTTTLTVAVVNSGSANGARIIDRFYRQNSLAGGVSGTVNGNSANNKLVAFGVGPLNTLIPNSMMEAPTYGQANATYVYNRLIVLFQLSTNTTTGTVSVTYKGCVASDGDMLDDVTVNMQTGTL